MNRTGRAATRIWQFGDARRARSVRLAPDRGSSLSVPQPTSNLPTLTILLLTAMAAAAPARAQIYKWVDDKGVVHFADVPPPRGGAEMLPSAERAPMVRNGPTPPSAAPAADAAEDATDDVRGADAEAAAPDEATADDRDGAGEASQADAPPGQVIIDGADAVIVQGSDTIAVEGTDAFVRDRSRRDRERDDRGESIREHAPSPDGPSLAPIGRPVPPARGVR